MQYFLLIFLLTTNYFPTDIQSVELPKIESNDISIIRSDNSGLSFKYTINEAQIEQRDVYIDNSQYTIFNISGTVRNENIGSLDLPSKEVIIGIPQDGRVSVSVEPIAIKKIDNIKIPPVPYQTWDDEPKYQFTQELKSDIFPEEIYEIKEISYIRDIRVARLKIYPVQYHKSNHRAIINLDMQITIHFSQPAEENIRPDYFDGIIQEVLLNGEIAKYCKVTTKFDL
ncbi:MAG: hypothetical protein N2748_05065 [candidate division WOR-3 bacterium]|nr:hypothetical protein [candidate division WOR-3 bacterium]